jgi:WD40 repeat protein/serine/threonine protein kinase
MSESGIFKLAVKLPPDRRAAYLDEACGSDATLRREVESLLRSHDASGNFLQERSSRPGTAELEPIVERPGSVIGPYKLMEQIGEGGFGRVFVAEQQHPVRRKVALKIIKPGMDSRTVIARFEAERQALALMDHPNIAKVLDAGTTPSGRPYFVMELVHGVPITDYCDANRLSFRDRLGLFLQVCHGIQHAHQKGVIHRDIKPSNILVTMYDDRPVPKLIDFGVAKAVEQRFTEKTIYTQFGTLVGTLEYMSPEQAEMNAFGVDTRSDIYSLGVLLYELLTGTTPLERARLRQVAFGEIVRLIKEEDPPLPSVRLSTSGTVVKVAAARNSAPTQLSRLLRGELDWVVMKCLEKNRAQRYDSAGTLARDLERYLKDEPVEARPPSTWYRFAKLARRNKVALTTGALVAASLLLGLVASVWQAFRATAAENVARLNEVVAQDQKLAADDARNKAEKRRDELTAVNDKLRRANYVADMNLANNAMEAGNLARVRELLDRHRPKPGEVDLRKFEWHYQQRQFHRDLLTIKAYAAGAFALVYSSDGKTLVSFGVDERPAIENENKSGPGRRELKWCDATTGEPCPVPFTDLRREEMYAGLNPMCAALSPDGKQFAGAYRDKVIRVWNLETGSSITLKGHTHGYLDCIGFSRDGKRLHSLAFSNEDEDSPANEFSGEVKVWDLQTCKAILSLDALPDTMATALSPDGNLLAVSLLKSGDVILWDVTSVQKLASIKGAGAWGGHLAFSPDGKRLASGSMRDLRAWEVPTGKIVAKFEQPSGPIFEVAFSSDGKHLATSTTRGMVELWDAATGQKIRTFKGHAGPVWRLAFSPDGSRLASTGADGNLKVWETKGDLDVIVIPVHDRHRLLMLVSPDGQTVLTGIDGKTVQLWNAATNKPRGVKIDCPLPILYYDFTPDWKFMSVVDKSNTVTIWDLTTAKAACTIPGLAAGMNAVAISPDARLVALGSKGGGITLWDIDKKVAIRSMQGLKDERFSLQFTPDGTRLISALKFRPRGEVVVLDVATGRKLLTVKVPDLQIWTTRLSPDSARLAVAGVLGRFDTGEVRILDLASGREVAPRLKGHSGNVVTVAFSPDGQRLATRSVDSSVKIWDLATGQETLTLKVPVPAIVTRSLEFISDGRRLISAASDGTLRIWDATPVPE